MQSRTITAATPLGASRVGIAVAGASARTSPREMARMRSLEALEILDTPGDFGLDDLL